jgi:hypothetical protein
MTPDIETGYEPEADPEDLLISVERALLRGARRPSDMAREAVGIRDVPMAKKDMAEVRALRRRAPSDDDRAERRGELLAALRLARETLFGFSDRIQSPAEAVRLAREIERLARRESDLLGLDAKADSAARRAEGEDDDEGALYPPGLGPLFHRLAGELATLEGELESAQGKGRREAEEKLARLGAKLSLVDEILEDAERVAAEV